MITLKEQFGIETIKGMCQNYTSRIFGFLFAERIFRLALFYRVYME